MATSSNHYQVLGVSPTATTSDIRTAYRALARTLHPDTATGTAASTTTISQVNQAWNVLSDPVRRYEYDRTLGSQAGSTSKTNAAAPIVVPIIPRAQFPWRFVAVLATIAIAFVIIADATSSPQVPRKPDQLLTSGSCVNIDERRDVYEVSCAQPHDAVVRQLISLDRSCPPDALAHRDRQGMGLACVDLVAKSTLVP